MESKFRLSGEQEKRKANDMMCDIFMQTLPLQILCIVKDISIENKPTQTLTF